VCIYVKWSVFWGDGQQNGCKGRSFHAVLAMHRTHLIGRLGLGPGYKAAGQPAPGTPQTLPAPPSFALAVLPLCV
jgi:hypothetical protein